MALHGEIKINGYEVGGWSARRTEPLSQDRDTYTYECDVWRYKEPGSEQVIAVAFHHTHNYSNGALRLAADVIGVGNQLLAKQPLFDLVPEEGLF